MVVKAVLFDIGGVIVGSPLTGIRRYEKKYGLPHDYLNVGITAQGDKGAFQRLERNEISMYEFLPLFGQGLSNADQMNEWYRQHCKSKKIECPKQLPQKLNIDGRELWTTMMNEAAAVNPDMEKALRRLRESGKFTIAALTNNHVVPENDDVKGYVDPRRKDLEGPPVLKLKGLFHHFLESSVIGLRKPDPRIFEYTLKELGVKGEEIAFLDDIGHNLKSAQNFGIKTIRVEVGKERDALRKLEELTGLELLDTKSKL